MNFLQKNWFWLLLIFILFLAGTKLFGPYYLKYLNKNEGATPVLPKNLFPSTPSTQSDKSPEIPTPVTVKNPDEYRGGVVRYKEGGFLPANLKLEEKGTGFGCLLKIVNESKSPLVIRLGPYEMSVRDNYGVKYTPMPAGGEILIDPRFGRRTEEFLNFQKPEHKFTIEFGKTCIE